MGMGVSVIEDVDLERQPDGRLRVVWSVNGECDDVDLAWGRSADGLDHQHVLTVRASLGEAVLDTGRADEGRARIYVSVAPTGAGPWAADGPGATIAGERRVGLEGPVNFRDLGGYRTLSGRTVRWGRVFRSDALVLAEGDMEAFDDLGIRTVYDLRSDMERETHPNRLPDSGGSRVVAVPLVRQEQGQNPLGAMDLADGEHFLAQLYELSLEHLAPSFGVVVGGLASEADLPAVFHCAAGKDRTGLVAAVLLAVLGVDLDDILDDYELTSRFRTNEHVHASAERLRDRENLPAEMVAGILRSPRWAMEAALTKTVDRYGDFDRYLTGPAGLPAEVPERLRQLLLTP